MKRLAIYVAIIAVTVAALILLWQFRSVLILLLLSLMLAAALRPSADYLTSRGLPVSLAWLLVYLGLHIVQREIQTPQPGTVGHLSQGFDGRARHAFRALEQVHQVIT